MTADDQKETIDSFHKLISNTTKYQILEDEEKIANAVINHLSTTKKLTQEQKNVIIDAICTDYMDNFNEINKPDNLDETIQKFKSDTNFAITVLAVYIDKYFYDDMAINRFNNLCLSYSDVEFVNENNISSILYTIITSSNYFSNYEKKLVLTHIIKECQNDIMRREKQGEIIDYSDSLNNSLANDLNDSLLNRFISDKELSLELIDFYFKAYILEDFQFEKIDRIFDTIIRDYRKVPSECQITSIYEALIELDNLYDYKEAILNIMDIVDQEDDDLNRLYERACSSEEDYDLFVSESSYGENIIRQYLEKTALDIDEQNVELINEIIRKQLTSLISPEKTIDENVAFMRYYFTSNDYFNKVNNKNCQKYRIKSQAVLLYQKICLISDYYNRFSEHPQNDVMGSQIDLIKSTDQKDIIHYFNTDHCFARFCLESFVEQTLGIHYENNGICKDIDTIKKVNPFYTLEQISNEAYQKKLSNQ